MSGKSRKRTKRPYRKNARLAGPFMCCGRSFIDCVGLKTHLKSAAHKKSARITALIESRCVPFKEIGKRVGMSGERIRQIAKKLGVTGFDRMGVCTFLRRKAEIFDNTRLARFTGLCNAKGLTWELIRANGNGTPRYYLSRLIVEGRVVLLRVANVRSGYISMHGCEGVRCDVIAYELKDGRWMLVPWDQRPPKQTMFAERPDDCGAIYNGRRHDYPGMIEGWHIFTKRMAA